MEMYNLPEYGSTETYLIQNMDLNMNHPSTSLGQLGAMYPDGAPDYIVEQGLYYPTATNYGYICTGYEPPSEWDGHHRIFGVDGQEVQYVDSQTENFPYIYFAPSYGYTQSPFNPYNPYIPGAMMGVDNSITGSQQFYTIPSYEQQNSSTAYIPMVVQSGPDIISGGATDLFLDTGSFNANRSDVPGVKTNFSSTSATLTAMPTKPASNQARSFVSVAAGPKTNAGPSKLPAAHGNITSSTRPSLASSQTHQGRSAQPVEDILHGKALSHHNHVKMVPINNDSSNLSLRGHGLVSLEKTRPKFQYGRSSDGVNGSSDGSNQGVKTNTSKSHLAVKAYTTRAGDSDAKGNIIIYTDQYNKDEFPLDHVNAKFFVIKSYSEDDVHKSIKYNVWSSTPNGNKKLQSAYEDSRRVSAGVAGGCPIYLFFSVNASGQFCGVAEMIGPVDFNKDMDFWQQDKWSGSFPVKWHFIKDVPNPCFRHIILENNENKPVTNSRDTQEIRYKQGIEMLKIFKSYAVKTSLLDDFVYYENRQKIMQEEKARLVIKSYGSAFHVPGLDPPRKQSFLIDMPSSRKDETAAAAAAVVIKSGEPRELGKKVDAEQFPLLDIPKHEDGDDVSSSLKIGSLSINPKQAEEPSTAKPVDNILTVGSMPVTVNTSGFLTVGSISLDPKSLQTNDKK